ncbi:MAG: hypothetical protein P1U86_10195 [Verrucomicrobiales bacterium]|nr:hypothetical protein [Verrucomicrobiales bacterium]
MSKPSSSPPDPIGESMTDFPARLSPMLVKELRQGMRTSLFAVAFILLQTFMVLCFVANIADPGSSDANGFFWFFIITTLLVVQPLRGFNALSSEYQLNTMDLIQLTKLSGWRITLGKWTALNAQTLLFVTGVLPYLVMRYFFGNVDLILDLVTILLLGLGSALASAITIGFSVFKNFLLRGVLVVGSAIGVITLFFLVKEEVFRSGISSDEAATLALLAVCSLYGCFFFLAFGASRIAYQSENLATTKRLAALTMCGIAYCFFLLPVDIGAIIMAASAVVLSFAVIDAVTEALPNYARVLIPFRKNFLTRGFALFFAPGWISGLGFFCLAVAAWWAGFGLLNLHTGDGPSGIDEWVAILSGPNLLIFPLVIIQLFFHRQTSSQFTFGIYAFTQACLLVISMLVLVMANAIRHYEDLIYSVLPLPSVLLFASADGEANKPIFLYIALITTALCLLVPRIRSHAQYRDFFKHLK